MKKILLLSLVFVLIIACKPKEAKLNQTGPLAVVTTTGMIADLVQNIGKDSVDVIALMGPGVDPHLYKATQGDLVKLQTAEIIFYNGLHLEGKMGEVFEKLSRIKKVVPISKGISEAELLTPPEFSGAHDPHIWFDPSMWAKTLDIVVQTLIEIKPSAAAYFKSNASNYSDELGALHQWVKNEMSEIPEQQRVLITAHDAFNYFGRAYNIEVRGLQGISTLSEFGLKDRVDLVKYIVEKKIKAVFVETSVSKKNINAIVEGCRQKGHNIVIGGNLYSDAMGDPGSEEGTYLGMVKSNVRTIVNALK